MQRAARGESRLMNARRRGGVPTGGAMLRTSGARTPGGRSIPIATLRSRDRRSNTRPFDCASARHRRPKSTSLRVAAAPAPGGTPLGECSKTEAGNNQQKRRGPAPPKQADPHREQGRGNPRPMDPNAIPPRCRHGRTKDACRAPRLWAAPAFRVKPEQIERLPPFETRPPDADELLGPQRFRKGLFS